MTKVLNTVWSVMATDASNKKQKVGNKFQAIPRTFKSGGNSLVGLNKNAHLVAKASPAQAPLNTTEIMPTLLESATGPTTGTTAGTTTAALAEQVSLGRKAATFGFQSMLWFLLHLLQHFMAAKDEVSKQKFIGTSNILCGDFFTPAGKEKYLRGELITAEDLDVVAVRNMVMSPTQYKVKAAGVVLKSIIARHKNVIESVWADAEKRLKKIPPAYLEQGGGAVLTYQESLKVQQSELVINMCETDIEVLNSGNLSALDLSGPAFAFLTENKKLFNDRVGGLLARKFDTADEYLAQLMQRLSQGFTMFVCGSVGSVVGPKLLTTLLGGASKLAPGVVAALALLSFAMSAFGAYFQGDAISIKNRARSAKEKGTGEMTFFQQFVRGVFAPVHSISGARKEGGALGDAYDVFNNNTMVMKFVNDLLSGALTNDGAADEGTPNAGMPPTPSPHALAAQG